MKLLPVADTSGITENYQYAVKKQNMKRAFDLIRNGQCTSRVELSREMGLSATAVSSLIENLIRKKLILESGTTHSTEPGRKAITYIINSHEYNIAVFSLSLQGMRYTLYGLDCGIIEQITVPLPDFEAHGDEYDAAFIGCMEDILFQKSIHFRCERTIAIGISFPGIYLEQKKLFYSEPALHFNFSEASVCAFGRRLGIPVLIGNVSMCLSYAEYMRYRTQSDANGRDLIFFNICDGVGAGIISNDDIMAGPYNTAGEVGHLSIDYHGLPCRCGNRGCLERYINQNAILNRVKSACTESGIAPPHMFRDLKSCIQAPFMAAIIEDIAQKMAIGIYSLMCVTGIRHVVIGGGIEVLGTRLLTRLRELIAQRKILSEGFELCYAQTQPEEDSMGMAMYYLDKQFEIG